MSEQTSPNAMPDQPEHPRPGVYRHYKGGLYTVLCVGRHSETEEWLVTYRSNALGSYWVRPLAMWQQNVNGVPRFTYIGTPEQQDGA